jgi:hypothetical protein
MRDKFESQGMGTAAAKTKAAKIFNATRKRGEAPVTGKSEGRKKKPSGAAHRSHLEKKVKAGLKAAFPD